MDDIEKKKKLLELESMIDSEKVLNYTKMIIPHIHALMRKGDVSKAEKYCSDEMIKKFLENKEKYRISEEMDSMRIEFARIEDWENKGETLQLKIYSSVFFYDNSDNNMLNVSFDKYWNDMWSITLESINPTDKINKCPTCGSNMKYNATKKMLTCEYCKNSIYYSQIVWKVTDIEVNDVIYR